MIRPDWPFTLLFNCRYYGYHNYTSEQYRYSNSPRKRCRLFRLVIIFAPTVKVMIKIRIDLFFHSEVFVFLWYISLLSVGLFTIFKLFCSTIIKLFLICTNISGIRVNNYTTLFNGSTKTQEYVAGVRVIACPQNATIVIQGPMPNNFMIVVLIKIIMYLFYNLPIENNTTHSFNVLITIQ